MFATIIRFPLTADTNWEDFRQFLVKRAFETYRYVSGLRAKAFILSPERGEFGGNYVWETQDDAEAFLRSDLFQAAVSRFGEPSLLERAEVCAYVEDGDVLFPPDYDLQRTLGPDAAGPPLGL